jgi:hypothetical protein
VKARAYAAAYSRGVYALQRARTCWGAVASPRQDAQVGAIERFVGSMLKQFARREFA